MLYYLLFEICPCLLVFPLGALIIYLLSKMLAYGVDSFEERCRENSEELQFRWRKESRLKEEDYYINRVY